MKTQFSFTRAVVAGMAGTVIMTLFTYVGKMMNIKMDIPEMLSSVLGGNLIIGWIMHFMVGIILAFGYSVIFYSKMKMNTPWLKGAIYGIIPWLIAQVIVMPMMSMMNGMSYGSGFFSGSIITAVASLAGHIIYGAVVGIVYKPETELVTA